MENYSVYEDIAKRTGGDIYIGVVGPVRTGKSTFIKRFMETLVLPTAEESQRAVMTDELPQSASGKTIMTTEPKFVPAKAAKIAVSKEAEAYVRLVDCVGYPVAGANGFEEDGEPRLVKTPWSEDSIPFEKAATIGTEKVIKEHSTIGLLVTTDGSITDIPRENYVTAEERAVKELKALKKPFVIVLNCKDPSAVDSLVTALTDKYTAPVVAVNVEKMSEGEILAILQKALFEFPVLRIDVKLPKWLQSLSEDNPFVADALNVVRSAACKVEKMRDCFALESLFHADGEYLNPEDLRMDLGKGKVEFSIGTTTELFYRAVSETCGEAVVDDLTLLQYMQTVAGVKKKYDKIKDALESAETDGYGIVHPTETEYTLDQPTLIKKGSGYGVQFKARASGYHIVKVDVTGEVSPIIGTKQQGEDFVADTLKAYDEGQDKVWETNIFGKSLRALVAEELSGKSGRMPPEVRKKMRRTITRVVNDGKNTVICILL